MQTTNITQAHVDVWRAKLKTGIASLKANFSQHHSPKRLFKAHCAFIDQLLQDIWHAHRVNEHDCLIAVGGYGRGELYPYSDIDLLILCHDEPALNGAGIIENLQPEIQAFISTLWDIGLNIGHSVRSAAECLAEAKKDITVQTNLIESRLLAGDRTNFMLYSTSMASTMALAPFFKAKMHEQDNRYAKYNDSAYSLEPNIKESPGGLRDLHAVLWLTRAYQIHLAQNQTSPHQLPDPCENFIACLHTLNLISASEARLILRHQYNLQRLRIRLHFLSGRREDRLLFDYQIALAQDLGYANTPKKRASEQLMQSYYRSVKFISLMNEILIKSLQSLANTASHTMTPIDDWFEVRNHLLEAKEHDYLDKNPAAILQAFLAWQKNTLVKGIGAELLRAMQRAKKHVNHAFRQDPTNRKNFIAILAQPHGVNHILRAMNRYGILGCYIPAFGKIIGQMQHDLFHVYTVDDHILNVLANLRRFAKPELAHEFPLCTQLFARFDAPHILYLAALFHDIAKGRGGDHSTLGTVDAKRFCEQHDLPKDAVELVAWLVEAHLKMSSTAQKLDLTDPQVIANFAQYVKTERRLTALYLLTVADIRGTSPIVWNAWKARLLENLFYATRDALNHAASYSDETILNRKASATAKLEHYDLQPSAYQHLWQQFGEQYFNRHDSNEIAWHSRLLTPHLYTRHTIVRARLSPNGDGIQIMIYTKDRTDLFARICNFFDRMAYTIVEAKIYTTNHDYALDSFIVLDTSGNAVSYQGLLKFIETELTLKIESDTPLELPIKGRVSRQVKHMPIQTNVAITKMVDSHQHQLNVIASDKPGLLATLAHVLLQQNIVLHNAKINTLGNRAEDTFLISGAHQAVLTVETINSLTQALMTEI